MTSNKSSNNHKNRYKNIFHIWDFIKKSTRINKSSSENPKDESSDYKNVRIQKRLFFINFLTLVFFIVFSIIQNKHTNDALLISKRSIDLAEQSGKTSDSISIEALKRADTANFYTRQAFNHAIESDRGNDEFRNKDISIREKNTRRDLRPYLTVKDIKLNNFKGEQQVSYVTIITNTGKTPAYNMCNIGAYKIAYGVYDKDVITFKNPSKISNNAATFVIGAGETINSFSLINEVLSSKFIDLVNTEKVVLYIYGSIFYRDDFGDSHRTRYCWVYSVRDSAFFTYERYNDAN
jgi:hypothetical protein